MVLFHTIMQQHFDLLKVLKRESVEDLTLSADQPVNQSISFLVLFHAINQINQKADLWW